MIERMNRRIQPRRPRFAVLQGLRRHGRAVALGLLGVGTLVGSGWWLNEQLSVTTWRIAGADIRLQARIDDVIASMPEKDFWHARPVAVREHLLSQIPDLADAQVTRQLPNILHLHVTLRTPVAFWQNSDNVIELVDEKGTAYRPVQKQEALDLPVLRVRHEELTEAVRLIVLLDHHDSSWSQKLSELSATGDAWKLYFNEGRQWLLPRGTAAVSRLQSVTALQKKLRWKNQAWRIDARMDARWFIRPARQGGVI